jgi:hypothetical protein
MSRRRVPPTKDVIIEASLDLAWSHWSGLGVRGTAEAPDTAVDPEALLYFTACLTEHDPRLRDEVGDWWKRFHRYISVPRLTRMAGKFDKTVVEKYQRLEQTFVALTATSGKAALDHLRTRARTLLRLRAVFGMNARAEVLLQLMASGSSGQGGATALELSEIGYSKRNVALVMQDLVAAGIVIGTSESNRLRYRLADPPALERVLSPVPTVVGAWHLRLPVLAGFVELAARLRGRDAMVQGVEAKKTLDRMKPKLAAAGIDAQIPPAWAETFWPTLQRWLVDHVVTSAVDSHHDLPGIVEGAWARVERAPRRPDRFGSAVLPRLTADPAVDREILCLDLVQVATVEPSTDWAWAVMSTAATNTYEHAIGMSRGDSWQFVTWTFGEPRAYSATYDKPIAHDRITRTYGKVAAERARSDFPAVQLRLTRLDGPS